MSCKIVTKAMCLPDLQLHLKLKKKKKRQNMKISTASYIKILLLFIMNILKLLCLISLLEL